MQILVSDANVLIDIEHGSLLSPMFGMDTVFLVPDILFEKELKARHSHLLDLGLKVKTLSKEAVDIAKEFAAKYRRPSRMDIFTLSLAFHENCPLLTGDKHLRNAAYQEGVSVYGTIWLVKDMLEKKIIRLSTAHSAFEKMKDAGSRLPWEEVDKLLHR
ncbi:MAG TPA: PIN domain-containing protein [Rhabdochlamydiaceae bacterium]|nr:PIN domain-containing protein [Rhabdochlamydiaceae bacterium]